MRGNSRGRRWTKEEEERRKRSVRGRKKEERRAADTTEAGRLRRGRQAYRRGRGRLQAAQAGAGRQGAVGCAQTVTGHLLGVGEADRNPSAWTKPTGPARRNGGRGCNIYVIFSKRVLLPEKNKINVLFKKIERQAIH